MSHLTIFLCSMFLGAFCFGMGLLTAKALDKRRP